MNTNNSKLHDRVKASVIKIKTCEFCHLGNGISIYTKDFEVNNDYPFIAHIDIDRNITYCKIPDSNKSYSLRDNYKSVMSKKVIEEIEQYAKTQNPTNSNGYNIFKTVI